MSNINSRMHLTPLQLQTSFSYEVFFNVECWYAIGVIAHTNQRAKKDIENKDKARETINVSAIAVIHYFS